jgi:hypothetical protein
MRIDVHTFPGPVEQMAQLDVPADRVAEFAAAVAGMAEAADRKPHLTGWTLAIPFAWISETR